MNKQIIIEKINLKLKSLKEEYILSEKDMDKLAIDISRVMDVVFTDYINSIKKNYRIKINSIQKEIFRKYLIGYPIDIGNNCIYFDKIPIVAKENLDRAYEYIFEGFNRKESTMINSIIARIKKNILLENKNNFNEYIDYIKSLENDKSQLLIISINSDDKYSSDEISELILNKYNDLSNYHYAILVFEDDEIGWDYISKIAIFMENMFMEHNFNVYNKKNKERRINELNSFIENNKHINNNRSLVEIVSSFYDGVAYGFQFQDLYISDTGEKKILVMQKIQLDESSKKCPSCLQEKLRGNSYPKILFQDLPIVRMMNIINQSIKINASNNDYKYNNIEGNLVINMDSTTGLMKLKEISENIIIGGAVTSPPYYNAREYSQWSNFICYLIDMMINAKSVYLTLHRSGKYLYNIGDIVGQDNIYINSNMSKRRLMLGFYSILIFNTVGYECIGNLIWNKGEVQSKRNSNANHFPGYLKPVNVYEHCLLFSKSSYDKTLYTKILRIDPVKKINSRGENILGHTAPYPKDVSKLIIPYINKEFYVLDPYLGSGTTVMGMMDEGIKSVGFEINKTYYDLCLKRVEENK